MFACQTIIATIPPNKDTKDTSIIKDFSNPPVAVDTSAVGSSIICWDWSTVGNGKLELFKVVGLTVGAESLEAEASTGAMVGTSSSRNESTKEGLGVTVTFDRLLDRLLELAGVPTGFVLGDFDD